MTEDSLGNALNSEGRQSSGNNADALFDQSAQAYRNALEVYTKADQPQDWALVQTNLGIALWIQGDRATGDKADALFDQSAQASRSALEVYTEADEPQYWAMQRRTLELCLRTRDRRASGDKSAGSARSGGAGVSQRARGLHPCQSAAECGRRPKTVSAIALWHEGGTASGDKAEALFDQAVQAYRNALEVDTKADRAAGLGR